MKKNSVVESFKKILRNNLILVEGSLHYLENAFEHNDIEIIFDTIINEILKIANNVYGDNIEEMSIRELTDISTFGYKMFIAGVWRIKK